MRPLALLSQGLRTTRFHIVLHVLMRLRDLHSSWADRSCMPGTYCPYSRCQTEGRATGAFAYVIPISGWRLRPLRLRCLCSSLMAGLNGRSLYPFNNYGRPIRTVSAWRSSAIHLCPCQRGVGAVLVQPFPGVNVVPDFLGMQHYWAGHTDRP